jgi:hypothetical protein
MLVRLLVDNYLRAGWPKKKRWEGGAYTIIILGNQNHSPQAKPKIMDKNNTHIQTSVTHKQHLIALKNIHPHTNTLIIHPPKKKIKKKKIDISGIKHTPNIEHTVCTHTHTHTQGRGGIHLWEQMNLILV